MKAVLLAGGEGVRLRPLTCTDPKPMLPIFGKPVLEYTLEHLQHHGVTEAYLTLQYLPQRVMRYFGEECGALRLHYALEETPLGTAGCVKQLAPYLTETFCVVSGDALTDADLSAALAFHREKGAEATLVLTPVECPVEYGIVTLQPDGQVARFQEKPGWNEVFSNLANTGIYILEPSVLELIQETGVCDFSRDVFPQLLEKGRALYGWTSSGYWCDIGSHEDYLAAPFDLLEGRCRLPVPGRQERPGVFVDPGARLEPGAVVKSPCWIGPDCIVGALAQVGPRASLGGGTTVEAGATVKNSVIGAGCRLGRKSQLRGAILGDRCRVRAGAEVYEGSVAAEGAVIGAFAHLAPGSRVWPGKRVESYGRVAGTVRWGALGWGHPLTDSALVAEDWGELPPERLLAWGMALAAVAGKSAVALSASSEARAQAVARLLESGIRCAGGTVQPFLQADLPIHRFGQRLLQLPLGAYVGMRAGGFRIHLTGPEGLPLPKGMARKLENALKRGTEPAAEPGKSGPPLPLEALYGAHLVGLFGREEKPCPVAVWGPPEEGERARRLLEQMGFPVTEAAPLPEDGERIPGFLRETLADRAMGLLLEEDGFSLLDRRGARYSGWRLRELLKGCGAAREQLPILMEDGLMALAYLQGVTGGDLAEYVRQRPIATRWERLVPCPWADRGRMIARLEEWEDLERQEARFTSRRTPGVEVEPMDDLPLIRLAARDLSQETAEEIFGEYEKKLLEQLKKG